MKRIIILGSAGSGKSTLAKRIGEITGIEVIHLDTVFWKPGWVKAPKEEFEEFNANYIKRDSWIIDGNYRNTLDIRLKAADTVIFIEVPRTICLYRAIKRRIKYSGKSRPDITQGCDEKIDFEFLKWIWDYPKDNKTEILGKVRMNLEGKEFYYLKNKKEIESFVENLRQKIKK